VVFRHTVTGADMERKQRWWGWQHFSNSCGCGQIFQPRRTLAGFFRVKCISVV